MAVTSVNQELKNSAGRSALSNGAGDLKSPVLKIWCGGAADAVEMLVACLLPITIFLLTTAAFVPALQNDFVTWDDDQITLVSNANYQGLGWHQLRWMFTTFYTGHYQPLSWLSFSFDYLLWGLDPFGFHLTNIVLHGINAALFYFVGLWLFSVARRNSVPANKFALPGAACFSALLFGIHPLRVESVAWATQRGDVLSSFFLFWTVLCYLEASVYSKEDPVRHRWMIVALATYGLSLLSNGAAITFPIILVVLDAYPLRRFELKPGKWLQPKNREILREKLPFLLFAMVFAVVGVVAQQQNVASRMSESYGASTRIAHFVFGVAFHVWKTVFPTMLSPVYELPARFDLLNPRLVVSGFVVIGATFVFFLLSHRWPTGLAIWTAYVLMLVPVLGNAQSTPLIAGDRYSYLACLGWTLLIGSAPLYRWPVPAGITNSQAQFTIATTIGLVILAGLGVLTWRQTQFWHDSEKLWKHAVVLRPDSAVAHYNLGFVLGQKDALDAAEEHLRRSLQINYDLPGAHTNLGLILARRGNLDEAMQHYLEAVRISPFYKPAYNKLAAMYAQQGAVDAAMAYYRRVLGIDPADADANYNMGLMLSRRGAGKEAIKYYQSAARLNPQNAEPQIRLAEISLQRRDLQGAITHLREALKIAPDDAETHFKLGTLLALNGLLGEAANQFQHALQIKPDFAEAQLNLGKVEAAQGNLNQAIQHFREAVRIQPDYAAAHESLAMALDEQGKKSEALMHRQVAVRIRSSQPTDAITR